MLQSLGCSQLLGLFNRVLASDSYGVEEPGCLWSYGDHKHGLCWGEMGDGGEQPWSLDMGVVLWS